MTIDAFVPADEFIVQGIGPYQIPHPYSAGSISVSVVIDGKPVQLSDDDFTVDPEASDAQGNVYLTPAAAATYADRALWIDRATVDVQMWQARQGYREIGMESQLDRNTMSLQELRAQMAGALRLRGQTFPPLVPYPGRALIFGDDGGIEAGPDSAEIAAAGTNASLASTAAAAAILAQQQAQQAAAEITASVPHHAEQLADGTYSEFTIPGAYGSPGQIWLHVGGERQPFSNYATTVAEDGLSTTITWLGYDGSGQTNIPIGTRYFWSAQRKNTVDISRNGFATVAAFEAAVLEGFSVADGTVITVAGALYEARAAANITGLALGAGWVPFGEVKAAHFAAYGLGNETTAMQAFINYLRETGSDGRLGPLTYTATTLDLRPTPYAFALRGAGEFQTTIQIDNPSRTGVGILFCDERLSTSVTLEHLTVKAAAGAKACLVSGVYVSGLKAFRLRVSGYHGATAVRLGSMWNCDITDMSVWGGGHNVPWKTIPTSTLFSVTNGSTTITANEDIFAAGDVGKSLTVVNNQKNQRFVIASVTDARTAVATEASVQSATNVPASFGGVTGSMTSGSATLTLAADVLSSDDVGRTVYVLGAQSNWGGLKYPLRSQITAVSGTTVTLADAATASVSGAELIFDPAVDCGHVPGDTDQTNDVQCIGLHVEDHRGTGLVFQGVVANFDTVKLHGVNMTNTTGRNEAATNIQAYLYETKGHFPALNLEQSVCGNLGRVVLTSMRSSSPDFGYVEQLATKGLPLIYAAQNLAPTVVPIVAIGGGGVSGTMTAAEHLASDGTAYFDLLGPILMVGNGNLPIVGYRTAPAAITTDANTVLATCHRATNGTTANLPYASSQFGLLETTRSTATVIIQRWSANTIGGVNFNREFKRKSSDGGATWGAWVPIYCGNSGPTGSRQSSTAVPFEMYFDTTLGKPIWRNAAGTAWVDATGATV